MNPFFTTTRSAARSSRFAGNGVRGHQPARSRAACARRRRRCSCCVFVGFSRNAKTGSSLPSVMRSNGPSAAIFADRCGRDVACGLLHSAVAVEAEPDEVVVLRDDLVARPREVQRERRHVAAEVVHVEHEVVGQRLGVAPHDPPDARVHEPVLVARRVDRLHPRRAGSPTSSVGVDERRDERARRAVDVQRDVEAGVGLRAASSAAAISAIGS